MTKFILHGGNAKEINEDNDSFFHEMTLGTTGKARILLNYFSREDDEVIQCAEQDKERILQTSDNKKLVFDIATPSTMEKQLCTCNVMYMRGGETSRLTNKMRTVPHLQKLFNSKVIAGSSAGVYVLSKYYWENDTLALGEGLGIFNLKAYCHYQPSDKEIVSRILKYKEDLPLLALPNYKWIILYR